MSSIKIHKKLVKRQESRADEAGSPINYDDAELYLETLIGPRWRTAELVFQTFDDNQDRKKRQAELARAAGKKRPSDPFARVHIGTWDRVKTVLTTINKNGGGVFLTVNETVGGRTLAHLRSVRAVWCERDSPTPPPDWPLPPHITVESSLWKFHFYWKVQGLTANDHHRIMTAMVGQWDSDPDAADAVRVLRVPGFLHQKVDTAKGLTGTPWRVRLVSAESAEALPPYTLPDLLHAFAVEQLEAEQQAKDSSAQQQQRAGSGGRTVTPINVLEVREALGFISPEKRGVWLKIGMALASTHHHTAFQLWDEWSRKSAKYDEDDQYRVWQSFREQKQPDTEGGVTLGTLYKMAKAHGWDREAGWSKGLLTSSRGDPLACPANISLILRHTKLLNGQLRFNTFTGQAEYGQQTTDEFGRGKGATPWGIGVNLRGVPNFQFLLLSFLRPCSCSFDETKELSMLHQKRD